MASAGDERDVSILREIEARNGEQARDEKCPLPGSGEQKPKRRLVSVLRGARVYI